MIYANSVGLVYSAQCHTLLTPSGQRELAPENAGHISCPECGKDTRAALVQEFEAFHVCGNETCGCFMPDAAIRAALAALDFTPVIRHGS